MEISSLPPVPTPLIMKEMKKMEETPCDWCDEARSACRGCDKRDQYEEENKEA